MSRSAAACATDIPASTEPVMATMSGRGCDTSAAPVLRSPRTTLSTPAGKQSAAICAIRTVLAGVVSDGFSTTVLPAASAGPIFHAAIIIG